MSTNEQAPVSGRPLTAEDVEIIRDYWSAYADADWHLIPEAIQDDFDARLVAVGLAEWRAVTADDLDDAFAHDRGLEAGGSCLDLTALGYLAFKADADGWMPWSGGENPVPGQMVECKGRYDTFWGATASKDLRWIHIGKPSDIIAFRLSRPASEQPVEAIGAGREEVARIIHKHEFGGRETWDQATPAYRSHCLATAADILAALSPASPARTPIGGETEEEDLELPDTPLARAIYKHFCDVHMLNPDEAADATGELLAAIAAPDEAMCSEHRPAADEDQVREWALIGLYLVEGRTTTDSESSMSIEWALGDRAALLADAEGWALEDAREDYNRIFCDRTNALAAPTPMGEPVAWIERQNDGTRYGEPKRWPPSDRARSYAQEMGRTIEPLYAAASPARTPMGGPQVLKGVGKINGDGWKDTTTIGEVVYVWNAEKPSPYAPGQYPRIGNEGWSASTAQYDFSPASIDEVLALAAPTPTGGEVEALREATKREEVARIVELAIVRHGVEETALEGTLRDADAILKALATSSPSPAQGGAT